MEKFFVISTYGEPLGIREAEDKDALIEAIGFDDTVILNVDEAMTLAEDLVEFVAEYRQGNTANPKPYEIIGVLQDIGQSLNTKI